jgi:hypothetical protein
MQRDLSTSELLLALVRNFPKDRISIQNILDGLGERSFGLVLLLFGLLSAVAVVPGLATVTALPLLFFSLQMVFGYHSPWLPRFIADRSFAKRDLEATLVRGAPILRWMENVCRPRLLFMTGWLGERLLGILVFVLALVIALPGPGTNFLPGLAIAFMAVAIIQRDGLLLLVGWLGSAGALYVGWLGITLIYELVWPAVREFLVKLWAQMP